MGDEIEFDAAKSEANALKHGRRFEDFSGFDEPSVIVNDVRPEYAERRFRAYGRIAGKGHMIAFTRRNGRIRLISFRRAHEKEMRRYKAPED